MEGDPFAVVEAMAIEAFAVGAHEGVPLHPRRVPAGRGADRERDRGVDATAGSSATSTSSSGAAPAPTSAARRRRSSSRSRASAASRATSRRSRSRSGCSASRPRSTTSRRSSTCSLIVGDDGGAAAFRAIGTEGSTGPKLFCVSGNVARPGVYEVEFGVTLGELLELAGGVPRRPGAQGGPARRRGRRLRRPGGARHAADVRGDPRDRGDARLGRRDGLRRDGRHGRRAHAGSPSSSATSRAASASRAGSAPSARRSCSRGSRRRGGRARRARRRAGPPRARSARRCATRRSAASARRRARRSRARSASPELVAAVSGDGLSMDRDPAPDAASVPHAGEPPAAQPLTDILLRPAGPPEPPAGGAAGAGPGRPSSSRSTARPSPCPAGSTILDACRAAGHRHADALLPREPDAGQRLPRLRRRGHRLARPRAGVLAQGRGRDGRPDRLRARPPQPEDGPRVPRLVGRPVDRARPPQGYIERYGADPARYGPPAAPAAAGERDAHEAGHHHAAAGRRAPRPSHQPVKVDNDLYVRDYSKCILCYKCVEACGEDAQNTFAIAVAGRGFDARISTEAAVPAARLGLRLLRQLHRRLPDRRADVQVRVRHARRRDVGRERPDGDRDDLPVLRRRLRARAPRPGQHDRQGRRRRWTRR